MSSTEIERPAGQKIKKIEIGFSRDLRERRYVLGKSQKSFFWNSTNGNFVETAEKEALRAVGSLGLHNIGAWSGLFCSQSLEFFRNYKS